MWLQWPEKYPDTNQEHRLIYQMTMEKTWLLIAGNSIEHVKVNILAHSVKHRDHIVSLLAYFGYDMSQIAIHVTRMADVWHRDSGPIFVVNDLGKRGVTDWNFNGWGTYPA